MPRLVLLYKAASRIGLMAVKKPVTKKGKTFYQTFYVKPAGVPKKDILSEVEVTISGGKQVKQADVTNVPQVGDGFVANYYPVNGDKAVVKIPYGYILGANKKYGLTWVIAPEVREYCGKIILDQSTTCLYELSTGLRAAVSHKSDIGDAVLELRDTLEGIVVSHGAKFLTDAVEKRPPVTELYNTLTNKVMEPEVHMSHDKFAEALTFSINYVYKGQVEIDKQDFFDHWDSVFPPYPSYSPKYVENAMTNLNAVTVSLLSKMRNNLPLDFGAAKDYINTLPAGTSINKIVDTYKESVEAQKKNTGVYPSKVIKPQHEYDEDGFRISEDDDDEFGEDDESYGSSYYTDAGGNTWDSSDLAALGSWVEGVNTAPRNALKRLFDDRKSGKVPEDDNDDGPTLNGIANTILSHMVPCEYDKIYRGTPADAWKSAEVGDVIPYGASSFSNKESVASSWVGSNGSMLVLDCLKEETVVGVDIDAMNNDDPATMHRYGVDQHAHEKEFLLVSPYLRVAEIEERGEKAISQGGPSRIIRVELVGMEYLQLVKSLLEILDPRIKAMSDTFDYPMRDQWKLAPRPVSLGLFDLDGEDA
jgi:hypothetical protein